MAKIIGVDYDQSGMLAVYVETVEGRQKFVRERHGRWVDRYGGKHDNPKYECQECRKEAPYRPKLDDLYNWYHEQDLSDYCPNCGAKMDGDSNA